jgi:hypothetical protein
MTEIEALRAIMSEVEALRQILKSEKPELADARPKLDEAQSIVGELIKTAERVKERADVRNLAEDVQRQIGNVCAAYLTSDKTREILVKMGFVDLNKELSDAQIADKAEDEADDIPYHDLWSFDAAYRVARALVRGAGLKWPEDESPIWKARRGNSLAPLAHTSAARRRARSPTRTKLGAKCAPGGYVEPAKEGMIMNLIPVEVGNALRRELRDGPGGRLCSLQLG